MFANITVMKILLWNCCNGIGRQEQVDYFNSFECDIAAVVVPMKCPIN